MAKFTDMDRAEAGRLREAVKSLEAMIKAGGITSNAASSMLLAGALSTAQKKIEDLDGREQEAKKDERERAEKDVAIAIAIQHEAALSAEENRQYQDFLSREYFTKNDFGKLEHFYEHTYDRLSEQGKSEMSHRVWEGVRREQYEFNELPDVVKEKEATRLRHELSKDRPDPKLLEIPVNDRGDFISAWDANQHSKAFEVLNKKCFSENVAVGSTPHHSKTSGVETTEAAKKVAEAAQESPQETSPTKSGSQNMAPEFSLGDLKLIDAPDPTSPPLPGKGQSLQR